MTSEQNLTAEEIAQSYSLVDKYGAADTTAVEAMKLYALQVADQVRRECAEKAKEWYKNREAEGSLTHTIESIDLEKFIR